MAGEVAWTPAQLMPKNRSLKPHPTAMPVNWQQEFKNKAFRNRRAAAVDGACGIQLSA